ncbi:hypothetical protein HNV12_01360 [Methanococcoides sp. SA1]|nr:hypothetical protein [Methanococcoides sp. SA1]
MAEGMNGELVLYGEVDRMDEDWCDVTVYSDAKVQERMAEVYFRTDYLRSFGLERAGDFLTFCDFKIEGGKKKIGHINVTRHTPKGTDLGDILSGEQLDRIINKFDCGPLVL